MNRIPLIMIVGPTACGKTAVSVEVAKRIGTEIISADSVQVYRGMDIGSAKVTEEEKQGIVHHLIDVMDINSPKYSVAVFKQLAQEAIRDISSRGMIPVVVGGTGLYVNALTYPLDFTDTGSDENIRKELDALSTEELYDMLKQIDIISYNKLHKNDRKRVSRAIEVYKITGKTISSYGNDFSNELNKEIPYDVIMIGLTMPREMMYDRINKRVDIMVEQGLVDEVKGILEMGYDRELPALQAIGYKELFPYFDGLCSLDDAISHIKQETRRFAKRQVTWFKRDERINWFDVSRYDDKGKMIDDICELIERRLSLYAE